MFIRTISPRVGNRLRQRGVTLLELMIGVAIGMLVVAVATGALLVSRGVSGSVSDASGIQQQAAYAMRIIGQQVRQAGSLRLDLSPNGTSGDAALIEPVAFEVRPPPADTTFDPVAQTLYGAKTPLTLGVGYRRYKEPVFGATAEKVLALNCLGGPADTRTDEGVISSFSFTTSDDTLWCSGNGDTVQPLVQNVADFQVRYLLQDNTTLPGETTIRYIPGDTAADWPRGDPRWGRVQAVEICMVLFANEQSDIPAGSSYAGCDGTAVAYENLTGARARRTHLVFRNLFQLRSQGLLGGAL